MSDEKRLSGISLPSLLLDFFSLAFLQPFRHFNRFSLLPLSPLLFLLNIMPRKSFKISQLSSCPKKLELFRIVNMLP